MICSSSVVRLLVIGFLDLDPEFEARVGDVFGVIVVDPCRDNVLIRHSLDVSSPAAVMGAGEGELKVGELDQYLENL